MVLQNKSSSLNNLEDIAAKRSQKEYRINKVKHRNPLPLNWLKWNTNASRIDTEYPSMNELVCRVSLEEFSILIET